MGHMRAVRPRNAGGSVVVIAIMLMGLVLAVPRVAALGQAGRSGDHPLAGKWTGEGVELTLEPAGEGYAGSLVFQGASRPVELTTDGRGHFTADGEQFPLTLQRSGERLTLQSGTATFELTSSAPAKRNPLEAAKGGKAKAAPAAPDEPDEAEWKTYRHPSGAYLEHPADWRTQQTQLGIALIPTGFDPNTEVILALGESAEQLRGPTDPQVGQYFDLLMSQVAPAMRRADKTQPIKCRAGSGALYTYEGQLTTGQAAEARFYTTILEGHAVAIAIVATGEKMKQRGPTLDRVFASVGKGQPQRDPALVGAWQTTQTESDTSTTGSVYFRTDSIYTLSADGGITSRSRSITNVTGNEGGTAAGESQKTAAGTWSAADGRLFIAWSDGTSTSAAYEVSPNGLSVTPDGGKPIALERAR